MRDRSEFWRCCYLVGVILCVLPVCVWSADCTKINACSCQDTGGAGIIDLSKLDGGGGAKFKDYTSTDGSGYLYSWNPCSAFSETTGCSGVSGCQVSSDGLTGYPIGTQDSATFTFDSGTGNLWIDYQATDSSSGVRYLKVNLICDPNSDPGSLQVAGETTSGSSHYAMALTSVYACPSSGPGPGPSGPGGSKKLSVGSILTIVFFALLVVYAFVGFAIQKFVRKASGKEAIPNVTFWTAVPGFVKDGVMFTFTCGRKGGYDKV